MARTMRGMRPSAASTELVGRSIRLEQPGGRRMMTPTLLKRAGDAGCLMIDVLMEVSSVFPGVAGELPSRTPENFLRHRHVGNSFH